MNGRLRWNSRQQSRGFLGCAKRVAFLVAALCWMVLLLIKTQASPVYAEAGTGYELIDAVNQLRPANGLAHYQVNNALMAAAQSHSDFQAENGTVTHTGVGGSNPRDRAVAFGYGGGSTIFVTENIASGNGMSVQQAVQIWQGDSLHLNTMLSPNARDVGAGVATAGDTVYYTLAVGYVAGEAGSSRSGNNPDPSAATPAPAALQPGTAAPTLAIVMPVQTATPRADGSVIHVVEPGQALWNIAAAYRVNLDDLLAMNGLTSSPIIYPGDKLIIKPADKTVTVTVTGTITGTAPVLTPSLTATRRPTRTPTATLQVLTTEPVETPSPAPPAVQKLRGVQSSNGGSDPLLVVIAVLVFMGTMLIVLGSVLKRGT